MTTHDAQSRALAAGKDQPVAEQRAAPDAMALDLGGMLAIAVDKGAEGVEIVERLVALRDRERDYAAKAAYAQAFANAQRVILASDPVLDGEFHDKAGRLVFRFSKLPALMDHVKGPCHDNGLSLSFDDRVDERGVERVVLTLRHVAGHETETSAPVEKAPPNKLTTDQHRGMGGQTNARRAAILLAFGMSQRASAPGAPPPTRPEPVAAIAGDQHAHLEGLLRDLKESTGGERWRSKVYKTLGIDHLDALPATRYQEAVDVIEAMLDEARRRKTQ